MWSAERILAVLDACCDAFTFPMLDNGYVYPASSRLSLHRSEQDWGLVVEVFGYSPRALPPNVHVYSFGSSLVNRSGRADFVSEDAYANYLRNNPHNESRFFQPFEDEAWLDPVCSEFVRGGVTALRLRGVDVALPVPADFPLHGVHLEEPPQLQVFELCRWLAATHRDAVLATPDERRSCLGPELEQVLVIDEWHHPDVVDVERPSTSETFAQLASVLESGDIGTYRPTATPNNHWSNWPEGGTL